MIFFFFVAYIDLVTFNLKSLSNASGSVKVNSSDTSQSEGPRFESQLFSNTGAAYSQADIHLRDILFSRCFYPKQCTNQCISRL